MGRAEASGSGHGARGADLDKADPSVKPSDIVAALQRAKRERLRLVAVSRPYALPADYIDGRIELEPLQDRDVCHDLLRLIKSAPGWSGVSDQAAAAFVEKLVERAEIAVTPYYLSLARVLAKLGRLQQPPEDADARLWLLNAYRVALADGAVRRDVALSPDRRKEVLKDLEAIAFVRVLGVRKETAIRKQLIALGFPEIEVTDVLTAVRILGVVETSHDGQVRFAHPTTLAYFASCFLRPETSPDRVANGDRQGLGAIPSAYARVRDNRG